MHLRIYSIESIIFLTIHLAQNEDTAISIFTQDTYNFWYLALLMIGLNARIKGPLYGKLVLYLLQHYA
jgi:hypothetical protein